MAAFERPAEPALVSCEVCLKLVPPCEATVPEAAEYFAYFCGLDCYEQWKSQGGQAGPPAETPCP
jgi:hypothetical protein